MSWLSIFDFLHRRVDDAQFEATISSMMTKIALKELAVSTAISYIAGALSKCEIKVFEENKTVKDIWYYTLNYDPNPNENSSQFWFKVINKLIRNGDSLVIQNTPNKKIYCADSFTREEVPLGEDKFKNVTIGNKTLSKTYKSSDVWYFRLEDEQIKSHIDKLYEEYGEAFNYAVDYFKNSKSKKYKLKMEVAYKSGDPEFIKTYNEAIKNQVSEFLKPGNAVYPQFKGYDLNEMTGNNVNNISSDIIALRKDIFEITAAAFKMPAVLFTGNITNYDDVLTSFITFGIDPYAEMITEELTRKTNSYESWYKGNYVQVDTSNIRHIDIITMAEKVDKLVACGVFCIDEIRIKLGENPLNTNFSKKHFITKNYVELEAALKGGE